VLQKAAKTIFISGLVIGGILGFILGLLVS
jgi:hypothetical protein